MTRHTSLGAIVIAVAAFAAGIWWNQPQQDATQLVSVEKPSDPAWPSFSQDSGPAALVDPLGPTDSPNLDVGHVRLDDLEPDQQFFPDALTDPQGIVRVEDRNVSSTSAGRTQLTEAEAKLWEESLANLSETDREALIGIRNRVGSIAPPSFPSLDDLNHPSQPAVAGVSSDPETDAAANSQAVSTRTEPFPFPTPKDGTLAELVTQPEPSNSQVLRVAAESTSPEIVATAERLFAEDLLNQHTIGFRRSELVIAGPLTASDFAAPTRVVAADSAVENSDSTVQNSDADAPPKQADRPSSDKWFVRLDLYPGEFKLTGNPLDIAINGSAWLQVSLKDGTLAYTRAGILRVDTEQRLCVRTGDGLLPLSPVVNVPKDDSVMVYSTGVVWAKNATGELRECGTIKLFDFRDATLLQRLPGGCYSANAQTGAAFAVAQDDKNNHHSSINPGVLEFSNAKIDLAKQRLDQLRELAKMLGG